MNTVIVYDSQFGNTEYLANVMAEALRAFGTVQVERVDPEHPFDCQKADLLILGSPTHGFRATPAMLSFLEKVPFVLLSNLAVASFDTRVHGPWGSAARSITRKLHALGVKTLVPPASFMVKGTEGPLIEGEEERAGRWATGLHQYYQYLQHQLVAH